jgi:hypothetical protein
VENYGGFSRLNAFCKLYSKILNERLKTQTETFLLECQNGFRKGRSFIEPLFSMKSLREKRKELNLENHLVFLDYANALTDKFFNIAQQKYS